MFKSKKLKEIVAECEKLIEIERNLTLMFTGHRSQKLPWGFNENDPRCKKMRETAKQKIEDAILSGYKYFISGMAIGFDMICAELVLELKQKYPDIKLVAALPCRNQDSVWRDEKLRKRYRDILKQADLVWCESETYTKDCMLRRNDYMLNNSSRVIALYNGLGGGTAYTIKKAQANGMYIDIIKP
ncbi:MAG: DUF1273 domain-containing protein [Anaeroplasma bactoclasticum]|nr:DUF1273 domain-containing protein [Anaeroplasma bactoclasticum]